MLKNKIYQWIRLSKLLKIKKKIFNPQIILHLPSLYQQPQQQIHQTRTTTFSSNTHIHNTITNIIL